MTDATRLPRGALAVAVAATAVGLAALLAGSGVAALGALGVAGALGLAGATAAIGRGGPRPVAAGSALLVLGGAALLVAAAAARATAEVAGVGRLRALVVLGAGLAALGAASPRGTDERTLRGPFGVGVAAGVGLLAGAALAGVATVGGGVAGALGDAASWLVDVLVWRGPPVEGGPGRQLEYALATLALLVALTFHSVSFVVTRLPLDRLVERPDRPALRSRLHDVAARADRVARLAGAAFALALAVAVLPLPIPYAAAPGATAAATGLVGASLPRWPLLLAAATLWALLLATGVTLRLAHVVDARRWSWLPAVLGGAGAWLGLVVVGAALAEPVVLPALADAGAAQADLPLFSTDLRTAVAELPTLEGAGRAGALLGALALATGLLLGLLAAGGAIGLLDGPSSGGALAAAGLVLASAGAGGLGASAVAVIVPVAAGFVAWDAARYGEGLAAEVSPAVDARTPLLAHVAATTGVALAAVLLALAAATLGAGAVTPAVRAPALVATLAGLVVLLEVLRRLVSDGGSSRTFSLPGPLATLRAHPTAASVVGGVCTAALLRWSLALDRPTAVVGGGLVFALAWVALARTPWTVEEGVVEDSAD